MKLAQIDDFHIDCSHTLNRTIAPEKGTQFAIFETGL